MTTIQYYEIAPGRYAVGRSGERALAVIQRTTTGPGRPNYVGVRGRTPILPKGKRTKVSDLAARELARVARFN